MKDFGLSYKKFFNMYACEQFKQFCCFGSVIKIACKPHFFKWKIYLEPKYCPSRGDRYLKKHLPFTNYQMVPSSQQIKCLIQKLAALENSINNN